MLDRVRLVLGIGLLALMTSACAVHLVTEPKPHGNVCLLAQVGGIVAVDPKVGVGLRGPDGVTRPVVWPFGYTASRDFEGVTITDEEGRVVAHEGDEIAAAGMTGDNGVARPCGAVEIIEPGAAP